MQDAKRWLPVGEAGEAMAQQQQASPGARILPGTLSMHPTVGGASPGPNQVLMTVQQQQGTPQDPHCKRDLHTAGQHPSHTLMQTRTLSQTGLG